MRWYETGARYLLGAIFLYGAVDGALLLFFDIHIHGRPVRPFSFIATLQKTTYFWAFMKLIQLIASIGLLANYKPALSVALLLPIVSVQCLWYVFEGQAFIPVGVVLVTLTTILCRSYAKSYVHLFDDYNVIAEGPRSRREELT
jgi:hypothetical protein